MSEEKTTEGLEGLGYKQELSRNRGLFHCLFMSLVAQKFYTSAGEHSNHGGPCIKAYGLSVPFATSLIGGGPATVIWGFVLVSVFAECVASSLAEITSRYPTAAGPYYWAYQLAPPKYKVISSWITGWMSLTGNWTLALSVNFGVALFIVAAIQFYHPEWDTQPYQVVLIFWGVTLCTMSVCVFGNAYLPMIDTICAGWTGLSMIIVLAVLSATAKQGRHSVAFALGHYDGSLSGWPEGFSFFIGLLPPAYTFSATGMIANMAEEVEHPDIQVPRAMVYSILVGAVSGLVYLLPIVFTLPDIATLLTIPFGLPIHLIFELVTGSRGGGFGLLFLLICISVFCAISVSTVASRVTWAFARDNAIPGSQYFAKVHKGYKIPLNALILSTAIQTLLGLIYLGSETAFNSLSAVGTICLGISYILPIGMSLFEGRKEVSKAKYYLGTIGAIANVIALAWVMFSIVLFCMPDTIPVNPNNSNYASVVFVGFTALSAGWYIIHGKKVYKGPPELPVALIENSSVGTHAEPKRT